MTEENFGHHGQIERMKKDRFICGLIGIQLLEAKKGFARSTLVLRDDHLNGVGIVQGGVLYSIADFTFAAAANYAPEEVIGIETSISFLKSAKSGTILAEAEEICRTKSFSVCRVNVTDESGTLLAAMTARGYVLRR